MKAIISSRANAAIRAETSEKINTETGGLFLGKVIGDTFYIIESIDPGPNSVFQPAYFEYDQKYTEHLINKIANLYDEDLELIGLWHRHPGSFDVFSGTDDGTNKKYSAMRGEGAVSGLVNIDPNFRFTLYHVKPNGKYKKIPFIVDDKLIPKKLMEYKSDKRFDRIMKNRSQSEPIPFENIVERAEETEEEYVKSPSLKSFMSIIKPYLKGNEIDVSQAALIYSDEDIKEKVFNEVFSDLIFLSDQLEIKAELQYSGDSLVLFQDTIDETIEVFFNYSIKNNQIILNYEDDYYVYHKDMLKDAFLKAKEKIDQEKQDKEDEEESVKFEDIFFTKETLQAGLNDLLENFTQLFHREDD